ncbi:integral membrane protein S linking to the trans Golgi network-domain-containing protein [Xylariaceae sp. FL0016]|nr:integral membrane protein S linking to the trans Golgi network-domain-containing protein [Xylariaceae sp. FL0016]
MPRRRRPPRSGAIAELPPLRILSQIISLQCVYYFVAILLMKFTTLVQGSSFSLDLVFDYESLRGDTTQGWLYGFVWLCNAGVIVVALVTMICRSKLVLDFAFTLHFLHLLVVIAWTHSVPRNMAWWVTMFTSGVVTVAGGTYGCQWRELRPITFGGHGNNANNTGSAAPSTLGEGAASGEHGDEEMGFGRGRGRGRGRDSASEYEMVGMKGAAQH